MTPADSPTTPAAMPLPRRVLWAEAAGADGPVGFEALTAQGCEVRWVQDGAEVLLALATQAPDVLVLDESLDTVSGGMAVCCAVRAQAPLALLPILMRVSQDDEATLSALYGAGATDHWVKADGPQRLLGRLRHLLHAAQQHGAMHRSNAQLRRNQDFARVGGFEWRTGGGGPLGVELHMSTEAMALLDAAPEPSLSWRGLLKILAKPQRRALFDGLRRQVPNQAPLSLDLSVRLGLRKQRVFRVECQPVRGPAGERLGYSGAMQDVTERLSAEERLRRLANKDPLTELPNRRQLQWRAERAIEQAQRFGRRVGLLLIDLDRFRKVNDTLGHAAGDELLVAVAMRLRTCVRHADAICDASPGQAELLNPNELEAVGRLGGDEFVALLPDIAQVDEAMRVAQRIRQALIEPFHVGSQAVVVSASIGVTVYPQDGVSMSELMRNADLAMDAAKAKGPNACVPYSPALSSSGGERLALEAELHQAIRRNELVLHYQPKIDARSRQLVGVEALMRWRRAEGLVAPIDFIPVAEETGLIVALSEWGLFEAARQAARWSQEFGFDRTVAVNLPSRMFTRHDLPDLVLRAAREAGIPHQWLLLEITETGLMKDLQIILPMLHRLSHMGVQISVDDFGTGYSSLHYLTELPISELKIDRSFVVNMAKKPKAIDVIHLIISLARTMNLRVVAEGVEEINQLARLRNMDCDVVQGYLFGRPMPGAALGEWVRQHLAPISPVG